MKLINKLWCYPYMVILVLLSWIITPFLFFADFIINEINRLDKFNK